LVKRKNVRDFARNRRDRPKAPSCPGAASDASERTAAEAVLQGAAEPSAIAREAAVSAEAAAAFEPTSRSTSSGSSSAASPSADSAGVLSRPQASVASGPAEPPAGPPVPVYHVHDLAYRGLLAVKAVFLDFLRSFVPADWVRDLDEDSFTQVESTLVLQDLRKREPDVVWRGRLRTDGREIVVVLVEVQSTVETRMALRLLGYMTAAEGSAKQGGGGRSGDEFRADAGPVAGEDEAGRPGRGSG